MADVRQTLNMMPLRGGLATAGQRSTIDEGQLWSAENVWPDLDGMLRSRPGLLQAGQYLKYPDALGTGVSLSFYESFVNVDQWIVASEDPSDEYSYSAANGILKVSMTDGELYFGRIPGDVAISGNWSLRFTARMVNPLGPNTAGGTLSIVARGSAGLDPVEVLFNAYGISTLVGGSRVLNISQNLDLGGFHSYELRHNGTTHVLLVYIDDVLTATLDVSTIDAATFETSSNSVELRVLHGTVQWNIEIIDLMFCDTYTTPFVGQYVRSVGDFNRRLVGGAVLRSLLASTGRYLYVDVGVRGAWIPLLSVLPGDTYLQTYQEKLIIFDDDGFTNCRMFMWDGVTAPTSVDGAPPVRFSTEYRTRLWASGDRNFPLRVYYTGSRQHDVWFAPEYDAEETYDEVINAGYIVISADAGDEVTGLYGDVLGGLVITTLQGIWRLTGSSPASFAVDSISKRVGGESPNGLMQVGNDLFVVGRYGVVSVSSAESMGNIQAAMPSGAIADKWSSLPSIAGRLDRSLLTKSYLAYLPSLNVAVLGARMPGSNTLNGMYVYAPLSKQWYGPWDVNPTCFKVVEVGQPTSELLLHGHEDGRVTFTGLSVHDVAGTFVLRSPMLSGRSLDPGFTSQEKRWRLLRLFLLPRVAQDFTVRWRVDNTDYHTEVKNQSGDDSELLPYDTDFRLDVDSLYSDQDVMVLEIELDEKGRYLQFELLSVSEFVLQGYQVEFLVSS
jgi:hypothetical protein